MKLQEKTMGENFLEDKKTNLETMLECIDAHAPTLGLISQNL